MSPSCMTTPCPSERTRPFSLAAFMEAVGLQILKGHHLGADEATLKVGVDLTGGLGALVPLVMVQARHSSSPAVRKEMRAQQGVAGLDEAVQTGLLDTQILQEHGLLFPVQLGDLGLQLGAHGDNLGPSLGGDLLHLLVVGDILVVGKAVLIQVGGVDNGLEREQLAGGDDGPVLPRHTGRSGQSCRRSSSPAGW